MVLSGGEYDPFAPKNSTPESKPKKQKKMGIAIACSVLLTGAGHMYLGEWSRGIAILIGAIVISVAVTLIGEDYLGYAAWILPIAYWLWSIADAHKIYRRQYGSA